MRTVLPMQTADGRGRPRDPSVEERVIEASRQELAERGFEEYSIRSVARRSGVSRPSLLLRWPDRESLIIDTLEQISEWPAPNPQAGLREELELIVARVVELLGPTTLGIHLRLIADSQRHPELFEAFKDKVMEKAAVRLFTLLRRSAESGELPDDVDVRWAADALVGVIFMRTLRSPGMEPLNAGAQRRIVTSLLTMIGYQPA